MHQCTLFSSNFIMSEPSDIIDLTNSFTLADHCGLSNIVIDLLDTDDSLCIETESLNGSVPRTRPPVKSVKPTRRSTTKDIAKKKIKKRKNDAASPCSEKKNFGSCPICWDELGKNPLASTKCGHVYCINCIQEYLKRKKKCPTCRQSLKGSTPYHPLYLSRE